MLLQHTFEVPIIPLYTVVPLNVATACDPVRFWYQFLLHLWLYWLMPYLLPPKYALDFLQLHKMKIIGSSRVIDRAKPPFHFFQSIFLHYFGSKLPLPLCRNVKLPCHVAASFVLTLKEAHPIKERQFFFQKISVIRSCYASLDNVWYNQGIACTPHHTLNESCCSKWQCVTRCGFSCAQECEFFVPVIPSQVNWTHSWTQCQADFVSTVAAIHTQTRGRLAWSLGKRRCIRWRWYG